ncbi:MAG: histidine kinase N-terminal domain-containing protein, partial [Anaerolineales bacterium]|nr:histidine kinase N-terminal domain-containing protein [Anaerolineales bacterium]
MDDVVYRCGDLTEEDIAFLQKIENDMPIVADISRADLLIYCSISPNRAAVVAQARPHSIAPIHPELVVGRTITAAEEPFVCQALSGGRSLHGNRTLIPDGAPVLQEVRPIRNEEEKVLGVLSIETNLIEHERHRRRSRVFQQALRQLQEMLLQGELEGAEHLSHFGEHDGILVVDSQGWIRYASGIATSLYRKLGYLDSLLGKRTSDLETEDEALVVRALREKRCLEEETREGRRVWIKKAIPLISHEERLGGVRRFLGLPLPKPHLVGALLTVYDETEVRRKERELKVKSAMIQEIHHRVKNNLQIIAGLLRMQSRRSESEEVRRALDDSVARILSVAVVHEFFAQQEARIINIKDVSQRIVNHTQQGILQPDKRIRLTLLGPNIYLPAQQATTCALIINELLQNAVEHGYERKPGGTISVNLRDDGDRVVIAVVDDGQGLPDDFSLEQADSLGLQIVQTLVQDDLKGQFELREGDGVSAIVTFPKQTLGGEEAWNERE